MRQFRLSTLLLLIAIAALSIALIVLQIRSWHREAELQVRLAKAWPLYLKQQREDELTRQTMQHVQATLARLRATTATRRLAEADLRKREGAEKILQDGEVRQGQGEAQAQQDKWEAAPRNDDKHARSVRTLASRRRSEAIS